MSLKRYQQKRRFNKTSEPKGKVLKKDLHRFVVQEHSASHHHFDFRLEMDGVLKSWAVPKEIPLKLGIKHLAVQVEDHPIDYIAFVGEIPEGNYGAGEVKIWDKGTYNLIAKTPRSLKILLKGKKLKGQYILFQLQKNNWLIFKQGATKK